MRTIALLLVVVLIWGMNWILMKIAMIEITPIWFGTIRMAIGALCLSLFLMMQGRLRWPSLQDRYPILVIGCLQMGAYVLLVNLGLHYNSVGRSVILVFSTPIWMIPVAVLFFKEKFPNLKKMSFFFCVVGILFLFNPVSFDWNNQSALLGSGLLLLAAVIWTASTLFTRYSKWQSSVLELLPWQLWTGTLFLLVSALIFEQEPVFTWSGSLLALLLYEGIIATAFVFWAIIELNRRLPAITSSLAMLAIPLIGIASSAYYLHEEITAEMLTTYLLLTAGIICALVSDRRAAVKTC